MKKTLKVLSLICTIVLLLGTVSVGMSAYAVADDVIGSYDFDITNVYENINWSTVGTYKGMTHVHTVRSDADEEINRMIRNYYNAGYDAMCLTDHGTINYGWTNDQSRLAIFEYQYFVHGATDELSESEYKEIITGTKARSVNTANVGNGMMEIPLGIELNGMSAIKCHINGFYADADHGGLGLDETWPRNAVTKNYNAGGFTHINHVGEWTEGNDDASVYDSSWLADFASIYEDMCPNRGGKNSSTQQAWMSSHKGEAGCIGMELVNTSDSRTHNDRRYVYDEILKRLAPQGINVFGFCEDDSHEPSDVDKNAQYFLINDRVTVTPSEYTGVNCARIKAVQQLYRDSMFYGEFYASSKNSKNTYELGNGFNASGPYPMISNIEVIDEHNQIKVTVQNATKARLVADGEIIETQKANASGSTITFDLNRNEDKINSYVRIYFTGAGGISYLQPFLVSKHQTDQSTVQFQVPSKDTTIVVKDSNGSVVETDYENFFYVLPAGNYTYTASRRGFQSKDGSFEVTANDIATGYQRKIPIELEELSDVTYAYFYVPETIYLNPSDSQSFETYIDRPNTDINTVSADPHSVGNVYFHREGATDISLSYSVSDGACLVDSITLGSQSSTDTSLVTTITAGRTAQRLNKGEYVVVKWQISYTYNNFPYVAYTYSYVYPTPIDSNSLLAAGGIARTNKNVTDWWHDTMNIVSTVWVSGLHKIESTNYSGYKYGPYTGRTLTDIFDDDVDDTIDGVKISGSGYFFDTQNSRGSGSNDASAVSNDVGYLYADRSRVNNLSEVPYLMVGLDINSSEEVNGKDNDDRRGFIRLAINEQLKAVMDGTNAPTWNTDNILFDLDFTNHSQRYYTYRERYNGAWYGVDPSNTTGYKAGDTVSNSMIEKFSGQRMYCADNSTSDKKIVYPLPADKTRDAVIPITGAVYGNKTGRHDSVLLQVNITVCNTDKSGLRTEFNNTVKDAFQPDWFQTIDEWHAYEQTIADAGKILGDPTSEQDEIDTATESLQTVVDRFKFKEGTKIVIHKWRMPDGSTGVIEEEEPEIFKYGENIAATAESITGYEYANSFECYVDGVLEQTGTDSVDLALGEKNEYKWIFYYTPNIYHATYKTGNGNETFTVDNEYLNAYYEQNYTTSTAFPSKTGYEFKGWYFDALQKTYSAGETFKWIYADDSEFTAQWAPLTYNVRYESDGAEYNVPAKYKTVKYGDTYAIAPDYPIKTGFNFAGWKLNGGDVYTSGGTIQYDIAGDSTLVAQWVIAEYKVTYRTNCDITASPEYFYVQYGAPYGTLADLHREGYTYEWYSEPTFKAVNKVEADTLVNKGFDHELFAKWIPNDYTITYNLEGGTVTGLNPETYNVESDDIELINPVRTGYDFLGWSGTGIDSTEYSTSVTIAHGSMGDRTYTAHWEIGKYDITYNNISGAVNDPRNVAKYGVDDSVTIYGATKTGYEFLGWTYDDVTTPQLTVNIPAGSTGDREFTAQWSKIPYTINYNLNEGTVAGTNPTGYDVETATFTLINPTREGYKFVGWSSNNSSLNGTTVTINQGTVTGNLTFTALWAEADSYTITYILNGGELSGSNPSSYKTGFTSDIVNPSRNGYTFLGWTKSVDGGAASDPTTAAKILAGDSGDIVFTAVWQANNYTIAYDLTGGKILSADSNPTSFNAETPTFTLINPVKTGYTFAGWTGTGLDTAYKTVTIPTGSTGNRSYVATWMPVTYTISYNLDGGADTGLPTSYTATSDLSVGAPIKPGHTFDGWTISFVNFDWTEGTLVSGNIADATGSYYSDRISLKSGSTYTISGGATGLNFVVYDLDGSYISEATGTYTADGDCVAAILANEQSISNLRTVKVDISGTPDSYEITSGSAGDMSFTANWTDDVYDITYHLNGGIWGRDSSGNTITVNPNPATYSYESSDILLSTPVRDGYTFLGWSFNGTTANPTIIRRGSTGDRDYTAEWALTSYSITYKGMDGATVTGNPSSYTVETAAFTLNNPTKTGYTFSGWVGTDVSTPSLTVTVPTNSMGNREYTATWTPETYSISYNLDGGTNAASNPSSYTIETATFSLAAPTKSGATFTGWTGTGVDGTSASVTVNKGSQGNRVYTAVWGIIDYTITYDLAGGTENTEAPNPTTYNVNSETIRLSNPSRTGYDFAGWTGTGLEEADKSVVIPAGSAGNRSYTATWTPVTYTIVYNLDGGEVAANANPTTYTIESRSFTLQNPVRAGFNFAGWTGTGIAGSSTEVTISRGSYGTRSYTATWDVDGYQINYTGIDGATFAGSNRTFYTVTTEDFTLYNPSKPGYEFLGWSGTGISGSGLSTEVTIPTGSTGERNYQANWREETYTINYNLAGGTEVIKNPTSYKYSTPDFSLAAPVKTGYVFLGWSSDYYTGVLDSVDIPTHSTGNKTFTAEWGVGSYEITLVLNGGSLPTGISGTTITYTCDTADFTIGESTLSGYTFLGWSGTGISGTTKSITIARGSMGNRTYTANFTASANALSYDYANGSLPNGKTNPDSYATNSGIITLINPTRTGYTFNGWEITQSASGIVTVGFNKVTTIDTSISGTAHLTAKWKEVTYRITYNYNGAATVSGNPTTYDVTDNINITNPVRTGYTFEGWSGTGITSVKPSVSIPAGSTGNRTYTANWKEVDYTITYNYNGGHVSVPNPISYNVVTPSFTLTNPVKAGYTFTGWTGSNGTSAQKVVTVSSGSTGNKEYTANFDPETYTITYLGLDNASVSGNPDTYSVSTPEITLNNPTKAGYTFKGWQSAYSLNPETTVKIAQGSTGDREYTALWELNTYTIIYNGLDGASVAGNNPTSYTAESSKIILVNPTKEGHTFAGWTGSNGTTPQLKIVIDKGSTGNREYTANWEAKPYNITYSGLAGTSTPTPRPQTYSPSQATPIPNPSKNGYVFTGWTGTGLTEPTADYSIPAGSTGDRYFTANWRILNYNLTVDLNGGTVDSEIPVTYTAESASYTLPTPKKDGYKFAGWTGTGIADGETQMSVTLAKGSYGDKSYAATWTERVAGATHKVYFYGYKNYPIILGENGRNWVEVEVGKPITASDEARVLNPSTLIDETVGYVITGWDIDFNADKYIWQDEDIYVHASWDVGPDTYTVTVNSATGAKTETCSQYQVYTAVTPTVNDAGQNFNHWILVERDESGNETNREIVSYYANYSFYVHTDCYLIAVYGGSSEQRAKTRVSFVEGYDPNYDWFTVYTERNIGTEYQLLQHGVIFTNNAATGASTSAFVIGGTDVKVGTAKTNSYNLTGLWTLSIPNPHQFGYDSTIYLRSYVLIADKDGNTQTIYSTIKSYINNEDITA